MTKQYTLGVLSRFVKKKNVSMLIEAVSILRKKDFNIHLKIGGGGELKSQLVEQTKMLGLTNHIEFLGWVEDKKKFFSELDIFCLPSLEEPFGIVILEAFKYKVPVVSTNVDGPSKIIKNGITGMLTSIDAKDFSEKVMMVKNDKTLYNDLIKNGYQDYLDNYSIDATAIEIEKILLKAIG